MTVATTGVGLDWSNSVDRHTSCGFLSCPHGQHILVIGQMNPTYWNIDNLGC
jgi:hypothetical protein